MSPLLLAAIEPPTELAAWVGGIFLTVTVTAVITAMITAYAKSGDKVDAATAAAAVKVEQAAAAAAAAKTAADAEWKAEVKASLKQLLEGQQTATRDSALQAKDVSSMQGRLDALDKRQSEQAIAHRRDVDELKAEFRAATESPRRPTRSRK